MNYASLKNSVSITTNVYLRNIPNYTTTAVVDGVSLTLDIQWNVRMKRRTISIYDTNNRTYLRRTVLNEGEPLSLNSFARENGVLSELILVKIPDKPSDIFNWAESYFITFAKVLRLE